MTDAGVGLEHGPDPVKWKLAKPAEAALVVVVSHGVRIAHAADVRPLLCRVDRSGDGFCHRLDGGRRTLGQPDEACLEVRAADFSGLEGGIGARPGSVDHDG